jgi:phosphoglycerate dehydrogenase-like enzyme
MTEPFRIGLTPDFYTDGQGTFEGVIERAQKENPNLEFAPMPMTGRLAPPEALEPFDAIFALAIQIDPQCLIGVHKPAIVARWGVGYDSINVEAMTAADIALTITPNGVRRPVAEAILGFIFALVKNMPEQDRVTRAGGWRPQLTRFGRGIQGLTLGSLGYGNIAREMFGMARPLGFGRFLASDPFPRVEDAAAQGVELVDIETVFRQSDIVAVNTWLSPQTRGLVTRQYFRMMKPTAFFINTARGPIVDHDALVQALRERWIAGAGIDVFPVEPPPKDDPLFTLDNVIVTPHSMAWTHDLMRDSGWEAAESAMAVARGEEPAGVVNRDVLARPGFRKKLERYRK